MKTSDETKTGSQEIVDFMAQVEMAETASILEAPDAIIKKWQPNGLPPCGYFLYKGVLVCPLGKTQEVEDYLNKTQEEMLHVGTGRNVHG